ncbi:MAG: hypothetical protein P4N41_04115 [Negativicutes bacterium]|nr:hypothetical protein [Negativicutes bacterium]
MIIRTIAVDLDDTLNNFTETLQQTTFDYSDDYAFSQDIFQDYLARIRSGEPDGSELLSTEYSFFRYRIHQQCYQLAGARSDGVEFLQWLKKKGWRIVICTYRDLRRANECTGKWLKDNNIPYDHLFMAWNKIVFCRAWGIDYLVDDDIFNIIHGERYAVSVFYPVMAKHQSLADYKARGFKIFDEVKQWMPS